MLQAYDYNRTGALPFPEQRGGQELGMLGPSNMHASMHRSQREAWLNGNLLMLFVV